jgi:2-phospho-L-lactate guanylyltransferase
VSVVGPGRDGGRHEGRDSGPDTVAVVPVKALAAAKSRLAPALSEALRRRLVLAMLADVLTALAGLASVAETLVVTPDPDVAAAARAAAAIPLAEPADGGLDAAVVAGLAEARRRGARRLLILPGDIPLLATSELEALLAATAGPTGAALAASLDGTGTNGVALRAERTFEPAYGEGSLARHRTRLAHEGTLPPVLALPGAARDIDEVADLALLRPLARYGWLAAALPPRSHA